MGACLPLAHDDTAFVPGQRLCAGLWPIPYNAKCFVCPSLVQAVLSSWCVRLQHAQLATACAPRCKAVLVQELTFWNLQHCQHACRVQNLQGRAAVPPSLEPVPGGPWEWELYLRRSPP